MSFGVLEKRLHTLGCVSNRHTLTNDCTGSARSSSSRVGTIPLVIIWLQSICSSAAENPLACEHI